MAHIILTDVSIQGDAVTIAATVDDAPVSITVWKSHLDTLATKAAKLAYIGPLLKQAAPQPETPLPGFVGTTFDV